LIKDAEALERFAKVDKLVVDKTGTLTEGKPKVTTLVPAGGVEEDELLRLAASLERASEHPLAGAIVATARERGLEILDAVDFGRVRRAPGGDGRGTGAVGALQTGLAQQVAIAAWRLARADRLEGEVLECRSYYAGANTGLASIRDGNATRSFETLVPSRAERTRAPAAARARHPDQPRPAAPQRARNVLDAERT
jgi:cation transport ATPase